MAVTSLLLQKLPGSFRVNTIGKSYEQTDSGLGFAHAVRASATVSTGAEITRRYFEWGQACASGSACCGARSVASPVPRHSQRRPLRPGKIKIEDEHEHARHGGNEQRWQ